MFYFEPLVLAEEENFTDHYLKISKSLLLVREKGKNYGGFSSPINEKILRIIWYEQKFERRGLKTIDGKKICILSPGEWNLDEGPDFKSAEIRFGEKIISGDVEVDLKASDWKTHRHHRDERYNQVVLHIFFLNDCKGEKFARKANGEFAERVELRGALRENYSPSQEEIEDYPFCSYSERGKCGGKILARNYPLIEKLLLWAGAGRFLLKVERFNQRLAHSSRKETRSPVKGRSPHGTFRPRDTSFDGSAEFTEDQLLYEGIVEGLGYKANREPMLTLARLLPLEKIKNYGENFPSEERIYLLETLYFYLAGLLPVSPTGGPEEKYFSLSDPETKTYLEKLWTILRDCQNFLPFPLLPTRWLYKGVRPANFPLRRLSGLSHFLNHNWQTVKEGFFSSCYKKIKMANSLDELKKLFFQPGEGYFARRTKFSPEKSKKVYALIGEERVLAILVNTVFPLAYLYALRENDFSTQKLIYFFYHSLKRINTNRIAQLMAYRLFGAEKIRQFPIETEQKQQGLLQIFRDFCDVKISSCGQCFFPQIFDLSIGEILR